ncbi:MAG: hypothetical protein SGI88_04365, partial [Candidatus Hydrogenedentes bacterium]|nr:hypothetical protein [Candidatus Hydrogenedentota bacterium]
MNQLRRVRGACGAFVLVFACASIGWAETGKISIKDWAKGSASKQSTAPPEPSPEPAAVDARETSVETAAIPEEALMPALEEVSLPPPSDASPEPDPVIEPQAALTAGTLEESSPEPEMATPSVEEDAGRVKTVTEWVAQNETPEPDASPINGVVVPPAGQMNAGQVRTGAGTIDFNLIELEKLNEELQRVTPEREQLPLSVQDAVQMALTKNRDIIVTAYEPLKADGDILAAKGEFDPVLSGSYTHSNVESKASSQISSFTGGLGSGGGGLLGGSGGGGSSSSNLLGSVLQS